ncbi:MAG: protein-methionine-sulfoxide reductase catalytic subunit MsrP [Pseudomonadota bacterium]
MPIMSRPRWRVSENEVTPERLYADRRQVLQAIGLAGLGLSAAVTPAMANEGKERVLRPLEAKPGPYRLSEAPTPYPAVTSYNNFYEFGVDKADPAAQAWRMRVAPWSVAVAGHCARPGTYGVEDLIKPRDLEERIYRLRCVEAWSMVIPWIGVPLARVIAALQPTGRAKYLAFETLHDPEQMPGQRWPVLDWPYVEGLRMDEAMHPLSFLAVGLYGKELANQNGAPLRLVVPWKYGFKSIKSIVRLRFVEDQPATAWNKATPREYGFYANVNPQVDHPRWSQRTERRIGGGFASLFKRFETLPFNGYGEEVAGLYKGMDLTKFF